MLIAETSVADVRFQAPRRLAGNDIGVARVQIFWGEVRVGCGVAGRE